MTNEEKLEALKKWMWDNQVYFVPNHFSHSTQVMMPIKVTRHRVAIFVGDNDEIYRKVRKAYYPIFIRDTDSLEFVIEKVQNTITKSMLAKHNRMLKDEIKEQNRAMEREKEKVHQARLIEKQKRREEQQRLKAEKDRKKAEEKAAKAAKEKLRAELNEPPKRRRQRIGVRYEKA